MGRTVLIVDDQSEFRLLARELLEADGFVVVGEAGDVQGALGAARDLRPDVVLLDVRLPDGSGVDAARTMQTGPAPPVVVLTSTADYTDEARQCGATGFIPKGLLSGPVLRAVLEAA
ncbi:MAG: response regulator transcription factor [Acidimicrobiia bacterium]|jgi:DNA-binding NarL/FixJ family response regulator|nr:response regulator transcription factor [Acidimicrobiia bacterium]MBA3983017.1 response regulator transcription factor [Acidimicrobiia bacterium]